MGFRDGPRGNPCNLNQLDCPSVTLSYEKVVNINPAQLELEMAASPMNQRLSQAQAKGPHNRQYLQARQPPGTVSELCRRAVGIARPGVVVAVEQADGTTSGRMDTAGRVDLLADEEEVVVANFSDQVCPPSVDSATISCNCPEPIIPGALP